MKSDFVMITKNDEKLPYALEGLSRNEEFINRLIIVDGSLDDDAKTLAERFLPEVEIVYVKDVYGNRATARQKGINFVETSLFAFVDSDVELPKNWYTKMTEFFESKKVGAVWGCALPVDPLRREYQLAMARFYRKKSIQLAVQQGATRGMLHDTMIRTTLVKDIKIPAQLHVMEDHYIRKHVENKGHLWISTDKAYCWHHQPDVTYNGAFLDAYYGWKLKVYPKKWYLKHISFFGGKLAYLTISTRKRKLIKQELIKEKAFITAMLKSIIEKQTPTNETL
jgi:glycosyltransferase involved in cell wall biosynthesis